MVKTPVTIFHISAFLILLVAALLRFYHLPENFVFAGDEEHQTILARSIVDDFHLIWIGVNAAHLGFYLGPYWTYFTAFWLWLSQGDPLITGYISSAIGILTVALIIFVGTTLFNKKVGIVAGLLYATLPLIIFYDQRYWNPSLVPLLSLLLLISICKLERESRMAYLFSVSFGMVFHTHLSLLPIIFVAIFWIIWRKIKLPRKVILGAIILFIATVAPLIVFDYFHKGTNITTPLRFREISSASVNRVNPVHHFQALFESMGRIWYLPPATNNSDEVISPCAKSSRTDIHPQLEKYSSRFNPPIFLSIFGSAILLIFLASVLTKRGQNALVLALFILTLMISFLLFPGAAFEYYLLGVFPLLLFLPGLLMQHYKHYQNFIMIIVLIISVLGIYSTLTSKNEYGYRTKRELVSKVGEIIKGDLFALKQSGICHTYEGWRYLFKLDGRMPERSDSDEGLGWLYADEITQNPTKYTVIFAEDRVPINSDTKGAEVIGLDGFKAYILKSKI